MKTHLWNDSAVGKGQLRNCFFLCSLAFACVAHGQGGPPQITLQPQSQTVTQGVSVTFTVEASSLTYINYQWHFNGAIIPGATSNVFTIPSVQSSDAGEYIVALTNSVGWTISTNASLTVLAPVTITVNPTNITRALGLTAQFSASASGSGPLFYQWRFNGTDLPGATDPSLSLTNIQIWQSGAYSAYATNVYGSALSSNALLTVGLPVTTASTWGDNSSLQSTVPPTTNYLSTQVFNTTGSVSDPGEPNHCGYPPCASYWHTYTPPLSGTLTINTIGTTFNAVLAVYTGTNFSSLVPVACSANHGNTGESISFQASGGVQYSIVIEGINCGTGPATLNFNLFVTFAHGIKAIAAGGQHSLVLRTNGVVLGWGDNSFGQIQIPPGLNDVTAISAGYNHSLALKKDGTVIAWGDNTFGQTNVPTDLTNAIQIAAGANHNLALRKDGTVSAFGSSLEGQSDVPFGLSNVVLVAAGYHHSLALTSDGSTLGWGASPNGETIPPSNLFGVVALAAGDGFSMALTSAGDVFAWGDNTFEQTNVPAGLTGVAAISAGGYHCLALKAGGTVVAWGLGDSGQTSVPFVVSTMTGISAGGYHSMCLKGSGSPAITSQPIIQRIQPGDSAAFAVMAVGNGPLAYQWRLNNNPLDGATRNVFSRFNAKPSDAGNYSVIVSNALGIVASTDAALVVGNQIILGNPVLSTNGFKFDLTGPGGVYTIEASPNLLSWLPLATNLAAPGTVPFIDTNASTAPRRFYRALIQ